MIQLREDWIRQCLGVFDAFITPTQFLKRRYVEWGLPADRVHVVANAQQDYSRVTETIQRHEAAADADRPRNRFAFFGQLVDVKGLLVVFEALKLYAETHSEPIVFEINGANLEFRLRRVRGRNSMPSWRPRRG